MKSLQEHNQERMKYYSELEKAMEPHPNGISCPGCGAELWDSTPYIKLTSSPPRKNIHCPGCGYRGYAIL